LSASFDSQPIFPHGIKGIFVSSGAKIGKACVIFQQVTIGSNTLEGSKGYGSPLIVKRQILSGTDDEIISATAA
jgi:serine O-acetyltransferase